MASENTIIIDVEVQASDAAQKLAQTKQQIAALKSEQKQLNEFIKAGADQTGELSAQYAQNAAEIKQLTAQEKMYTAQLNITTQGNRKMGDSLVEMSATLAQLKAEYRGMTAAQRESAGGKELLASIQQLDAKMKEANGTMGNYQSALLGLYGTTAKVASLFAGGFKNGLAAAGNAVKAFGKTLLTTPLGWILAAFKAVMVVIDQVRDAFKRNDEAGTALSVALSRLQPVITVIRKGFEGLATAVAAVVGGITKAATALLMLIPRFREAANAAAELKTAEDALQDTERQYTIDSAERAKQRAKLEDEARSNEKLTAEQRLALLQESADLAKKDLEERQAIAAERYRLLKEEAKESSDTSDAMKDKLAEAYAAMINAETEFVQGTRRLNMQMKSARQEIERDQQQAAQAARQRWEEAKRARQEAAKTETDELRKLEDMTIAMISDEAEREIAAANAKYTREVADLRKRLDEEKNLTAKAREAIAKQAEMLEGQQAAEVAKIREKYSKEALDREIVAQEAIIDARISMMQEGQAKEEAQTNARYASEIAALRRTLAEESNLTMAEREALNEKIKSLETQQAADIAAIRKKAWEENVKSLYEQSTANIANLLNEKLLEAGENASLQAQAQLEAARSQLAQLRGMTEQTYLSLFGTEEAYKAAVLAAEKEIYDARKASEDALAQQAQQIGDTMQAVTSSLSDVFEAVAGDTEEYEKFKKAMAIVDAMISMATTIAAATTASTQGDPYTMAIRIAANVAAVTAQFAAVIKAIKAAAIPSAPSFAEGGIVPGTDYTGDKVVSRLNSGEMVLTKPMQENLLRLLSAGVPAYSVDYSRMREAFREAVAELPAPTLVYSQFEDFTRNIRKINNITRL